MHFPEYAFENVYCQNSRVIFGMNWLTGCSRLCRDSCSDRRVSCKDSCKSTTTRRQVLTGQWNFESGQPQGWWGHGIPGWVHAYSDALTHFTMAPCYVRQDTSDMYSGVSDIYSMVSGGIDVDSRLCMELKISLICCKHRHV